MSITIEYKGCEFEFDSIPSDGELERRYRKRSLNATQITLPVPEAPDLRRDLSPYDADVLEGRRIDVYCGSESPVREPVGRTLERLGADARSVAPEADETSRDAGSGIDGLLFDATQIDSSRDLDELLAFFQARRSGLGEGARIVVVGRPPGESQSYRESAARRAVDGFTRSLAREVGPDGGTANLVEVESGAEAHLFGPLRFFLSDKTAFVSGQTLRVTATGPSHPDDAELDRVLEGKTAMVTGAAHGIGRATAAQFAREGAEVVCIDLPGEDLEEAVDAIGGEALPLDVSDEAAPERVVERARAHGGFDVVLHNAGILAGRGHELDTLGADVWRKTLQVNLEAPVRLTKALLAEELLNDWGRVMTMSSVAGLVGNMREANYSTTKAGLVGIVQHYSKRLIERGITVNAVTPAHIETQMSADMPKHLGTLSRRFCALTQGGFPRDVAQAAAFLATPSAQGVNGQVFRVCGQNFIGT